MKTYIVKWIATSLVLGVAWAGSLQAGGSSELPSFQPVSNHSCLDTTPPAPPSGVRLSKTTFRKNVGVSSAPTLTALPLTEPALRPGWVILRVVQLDLNAFPVVCASADANCFGADRYVVEEYQGASGSIISAYTLTPSTSQFDLPLFRGLYGATRSYRVRFYPGARSMNGCVLDTTMTGAVQIPDKVRVQIRNNLTSTTNNDVMSDSKIVRVRTAADMFSLHTGPDPEMLTKDACQPQSATVNQVIPAGAWPGTGSFYTLDDGQTINTPLLHIGLGDWADSDPPCGGPNQRKRPFYVALDGNAMFRFAEFNLARKFGETVIALTSNAGNVTVSLAATHSGLPVAPTSSTLQSTAPTPDPITP